MKKYIALLLLSCFFINAAGLSQAPKSISVKTGLSKPFAFTDEDEIYEYPTDYYLGVNLEFIHHDKISFLAETGLTRKSDNFIYLSPLFKIRWEFRNLIPYLFAGPRLDFVIPTRANIQSDYIDKFNFCVFGIGYGFGIEYLTLPFGYVYGCSHQYDFTNVLNEDRKNPKEANYHHSTFIISIGMKAYFGANKKK